MAATSYSLFTLIPYCDHFLLYTNVKEAYLFTTQYKKCLKTGSILKSSSEELSTLLKKDKYNDHIVFHAFYELGDHFVSINSEEVELGIWIEFESVKKVSDLGVISGKVDICWKELSFESYQASFNTGKKHLERGDCYQYNLTRQLKGILKGETLNLVRKVWSHAKDRGAYGSFTYSSVLNRSFFSNSPECLFQVGDNEIETMPIKGTVKREGLYRENKKKLLLSIKNESELNMITDLLLHDLNSLSSHKAYVNKKKELLKVPGLLHTYSSLKAPYKGESLYEILTALFPGGSITGAPKKRVRELIHLLEHENRGFYCGSTVILSKQIQAASINIRSLVIDEENKSLSYGSGGGITFASSVEEEFKELLAKKDSFNDLTL